MRADALVSDAADEFAMETHPEESRHIEAVARCASCDVDLISEYYFPRAGRMLSNLTLSLYIARDRSHLLIAINTRDPPPVADVVPAMRDWLRSRLSDDFPDHEIRYETRYVTDT